MNSSFGEKVGKGLGVMGCQMGLSKKLRRTSLGNPTEGPLR